MNRVSALILPLLTLANLAQTPTTQSIPDPAELVIVFQRQKDPVKVREDADKFSAALSAELKIRVTASIPTDYSASVQALVSKKADLAYVSAIPFLLARRDGNASVLLAESRPSTTTGEYQTTYDSVFVVRKDSRLNSYDDLLASAGSVRMVFTSPTSTSGYVFPLARFVTQGLVARAQDPREIFQSVAFGGSYTAALEQLLQDRADVAAVSDYTIEGKNADVYLAPEKRAQLRVLSRTPGVPTHVLAARDGLSPEFKTKLKSAILKVSTDNPTLLSSVYGATRFVEVDEKSHLAPALRAIEKSALPLENLTR